MRIILSDLYRSQAQETCHASSVLVSSRTYVAVVESHGAKSVVIG
jgi:hypothetical protein